MTQRALLITAFLGAMVGHAQAVQPGADWMPMDQVVRKLGEAGYGEIQSLKADDGRWKGKIVKDGRSVAVAVDSRNGSVTEISKVDKILQNKD